jgi:hypothetical protein
MATNKFIALMLLSKPEGGFLAQPGEEVDLSHIKPANRQVLLDMGAIMPVAEFEALPEKGKARVFSGKYNVQAGDKPEDLKKEG